MKTTLIFATIFTFLFAQSGFAQEVLNLNAKYAVPVSESLQPLATFDIEQYQIITNEKGVRYMSYSLPEDLTAGEQIDIVMPLIAETDTGHKTFQNEQGLAECSGKWIALSCDIKFQNLDFSEDKVVPFLLLKYGYNKETKNRIAISRKFMNDPIGTVKTNGKKEEPKQ